MLVNLFTSSAGFAIMKSGGTAMSIALRAVRLPSPGACPMVIPALPAYSDPEEVSFDCSNSAARVSLYIGPKDNDLS